jgi:hypothetical protein
MDSALLAGQIGVSGLSLGAFSATLDMIGLVNRGFDVWAEFSGLEGDLHFFRTQILLQRDIFDSWKRDWFGFHDHGDVMSVGKLRLLKAHETTIQSTLQSIKIEFGKLEQVGVLDHKVQSLSTAERMSWVSKNKTEAIHGLGRIDVLLKGLYMIFPLQSPFPAAPLLLSLPETKADELKKWSESLGKTSSLQLVHGSIAIQQLRQQLDVDLERRVKSFQNSIPDKNLGDTPVPEGLEAEEGTAGSRSWGKLGERRVMVEWKNYRTLQGQQAILVLGRNNNLARMLNAASKPDELLTLHCEGYFDDVAEKRYGFVFSSPAKGSEKVSSLNKLLKMPPAERLPTLRQRYQLAYQLSMTVFILLTTGWLHKGLRSHNIMFVHDGDEIQWTRPYLCGFAYSRPDKPDEFSEKLEHSERFNVYRHPLAQGQPNEDYHKSFDIYSFGIILFEIANWDAAFSLWDHNPKRFRERLCRPGNQRRVAHKVGVDFRDAMIKCVEGAFDADEDSITRRFFVEVVEVLRLQLGENQG